MSDGERYEHAARELWKLLDDIDTLDDVCKFNDRAFRLRTRKRLQARHALLETDGYTLRLPARKDDQ